MSQMLPPSDLPLPFRPLASQLNRRLEFRGPLVLRNLVAEQHQYAARGLGNSGALISALLLVFEEEAAERAGIIETTLRQYRLSLAPVQIIEHSQVVRAFLAHCVAQQCQHIRTECEAALQPLLFANGQLPAVSRRAAQRMDDCTRSAQGLIIAVWDELVMAAETDKTALSNADRPSYVTVHGSVGAIAQGAATIGNVHQQIAPAFDLQQALVLVQAAVQSWPTDAGSSVEGAQAALAEEAASGEPDQGLAAAALRKIGNIALKVGTDAGSQMLLAYLRTHGLLPP